VGLKNRSRNDDNYEEKIIMVFTIEIVKDEKQFIAKCKELNVYSYGSSSEKAVQRLKKVISFYIQSAAEYLDVDSPEAKKNLPPVQENKELN
jgi:predicted RNase H-like HicB family nuclease